MLSANLIAGVAILLAGSYCALAGLMGWDWFLNSRKAQFMVKTFGRTGARIFYALIGLAIITFGILTLVGKIEVTS